MKRKKISKAGKSRSASQDKKLARKVRSLRLHHKVFFSLVGFAGIVLVWRGTWMFFDTAPFLNHPVSSLVIGFALVIISGFLFKIA